MQVSCKVGPEKAAGYQTYKVECPWHFGFEEVLQVHALHHSPLKYHDGISTIKHLLKAFIIKVAYLSSLHFRSCPLLSLDLSWSLLPFISFFYAILLSCYLLFSSALLGFSYSLLLSLVLYWFLLLLLAPSLHLYLVICLLSLALSCSLLLSFLSLELSITVL